MHHGSCSRCRCTIDDHVEPNVDVLREEDLSEISQGPEDGGAEEVHFYRRRGNSACEMRSGAVPGVLRDLGFVQEGDENKENCVGNVRWCRVRMASAVRGGLVYPRLRVCAAHFRQVERWKERTSYGRPLLKHSYSVITIRATVRQRLLFAM